MLSKFMMFNKKSNKKKRNFTNQFNLKIIKNCIKVGYEIVKNSSSHDSLYQEIQEQERVYRKYIEYKKQPPHFTNNLEKIIILFSVAIFTILLIAILLFLEIIKNGFIIFGLVIYMVFAIDFFISALSAPLNIKNRIVITKKDKKVLEQRRKRKEAELLEDCRRKEEEEEKRREQEKQNRFLGGFMAIAALGVTSQLNKSNKVYVKGHYRKKRR